MAHPTNSELLTRLIRLEEKFDNMNGSLRSEIGTIGNIVMDLNKKAVKQQGVEEYKATQASRRYTKVWMEVGKQLTIILGIIAAILYAYAQTRGIK